jgi:hypothetical protein
MDRADGVKYRRRIYVRHRRGRSTSKLVFALIYRKVTKPVAAPFLKVLVRIVPYRIHTILTDNSVQFVDRYQGVSQT